MSANTIEAWVSILWCRNWLPVSKIIWKRGSWCEVVEYSDWLDDALWIEWECQSVSYDSETTCVEENDNIYILRFSEVDWTFRVYDFSWTDVTWTVTPIKCSSSEMFDIRSAWFYCIDWTITLERFDIIDLSNNTVSSSIWQDLTWVVVSSPTGVITAWACIINNNVNVVENNFSQVDSFWNPTWQVIKEIREYDNAWNLISTQYVDTVTWLPITLSPSTSQLAPVTWLQKSSILMCDSWNSFIRHIVYSYWTNSLTSFDTQLDWVTPYTVSWIVTWWECKWNIPSSTQYYMWDNWPFIWTAIYDNNWSLSNISTLNWNTPSSINSIAYSEYWYSVTANTIAWTTLNDFLANNSPDYNSSKVISLSIMVDDDINDFEYSVRNSSSSTRLKAWINRSISWWEWNQIPINNKFFWEFNILSDSLITVSWEQLEI